MTCFSNTRRAAQFPSRLLTTHRSAGSSSLGQLVPQGGNHRVHLRFRRPAHFGEFGHQNAATTAGAERQVERAAMRPTRARATAAGPTEDAPSTFSAATSGRSGRLKHTQT